MTPSQSGFVIMIEWDGRIPPTKWYDRLHRMGLKVRGDKDVSPVARRMTNGLNERTTSRRGDKNGVVFQEGSILCDSYSAARLIASLASELGARSVSVGNIELTDFHMTQLDLNALEGISKTWSKRGPKFHDDAGNYCVTCLEEGKTFEVDALATPVICPSCNGTHFTVRKGSTADVAVKAFDFDGWLSSRFYGTGFEIPRVSVDPDKALPSPDIASFDPKLTYKLYEVNSVANSLNLSGVDLFGFLDAAYTSMQLDATSKLNKRIEALRIYFQAGGQKPYSMVSRDIPDVVDVAAVNGYFAKYL